MNETERLPIEAAAAANRMVMSVICPPAAIALLLAASIICPLGLLLMVWLVLQ